MRKKPYHNNDIHFQTFLANTREFLEESIKGEDNKKEALVETLEHITNNFKAFIQATKTIYNEIKDTHTLKDTVRDITYIARDIAQEHHISFNPKNGYPDVLDVFYNKTLKLIQSPDITLLQAFGNIQKTPQELQDEHREKLITKTLLLKVAVNQAA